MFLFFRGVDPDLGRGEARGQVRQQLADRAARHGQHLCEPQSSIERVVVAVIAIGEEDVARELPAEWGVFALDLVPDQTVSRLPHDRNATVPRDVVEQPVRALYVAYDFFAGTRGENETAVQGDKLISVQHAAAVVDDADAVRVTVEAD